MKLYKLTGLQNLDLPLQIHFRFWLFQVRRRENNLTKSNLVTLKKRGGRELTEKDYCYRVTSAGQRKILEIFFRDAFLTIRIKNA